MENVARGRSNPVARDDIRSIHFYIPRFRDFLSERNVVAIVWFRLGHSRVTYHEVAFQEVTFLVLTFPALAFQEPTFL